MVKVLIMSLALCICGPALSAQEEPPPLESRPTIWYAVLVQPPAICSCFPIKPLPKKQGPTLSVDIPLSPFWDTVREDRIKNNTIQFGGSATPWKNTAIFGGWPVPRIIFAASDFRAMLEGGIMKTLNVSPSRIMGQVRGGLEGSVFYVLVGADGFWGQEQVLSATKGVNFDANFRRLSFGRQGWLGVKVGDFNRNFIAGRYGKGYAWTEGETRFVVPSIIGELDWFPAYFEEFKTTSVSVEGKVKVKRISQSIRFDDVKYERVIPSPDPLRFGENRLHDLWLRTETEVMPLSHVGVVVIWTKDFRDQNRLMFINDYSSVRVLLRLVFN